MIKVNSKVIIKGLVIKGDSTIKNVVQKLRANIELRATGSPDKYSPPVMIIEGLYYMDIRGLPKYELTKDDKPTHAKCIWYNTRNELQSAFINLELLTEL